MFGFNYIQIHRLSSNGVLTHIFTENSVINLYVAAVRPGIWVASGRCGRAASGRCGRAAGGRCSRAAGGHGGKYKIYFPQ